MSHDSKSCVLVVDDEPDLCETVQIVLQLEGYDVVTSCDGVDALAQLRGGVHPCLILLDLMMPRMSGMQFRQEQLHDPALREIPVLAVTGGGDAALRKASDLGLRALRKPLELETLLELVDRYCGAHA